MYRRLIAAGCILLAGLIGCADTEQAPEAPPPAEGPQALEGITAPAAEGTVHLVRMVQRGDRYGFEPDTITVPSGDVVRFVLTGSQPESVAFDKTGATPEISAFIDAGSLERGILLTNPGDSFDVSFSGAPAGNYPFFSVPHAIQGMRGVISVEAPGE